MYLLFSCKWVVLESNERVPGKVDCFERVNRVELVRGKNRVSLNLVEKLNYTSFPQLRIKLFVFVLIFNR